MAFESKLDDTFWEDTGAELVWETDRWVKHFGSSGVYLTAIGSWTDDYRPTQGRITIIVGPDEIGAPLGVVLYDESFSYQIGRTDLALDPGTYQFTFDCTFDPGNPERNVAQLEFISTSGFFELSITEIAFDTTPPPPGGAIPVLFIVT